MKSKHLFWVVLLVCLTQSFFLIYLSSNIKVLETQVSILASEYEKMEQVQLQRREQFQAQFKSRKKERLNSIRMLISEELNKHHKKQEDMIKHAAKESGTSLNAGSK